ncbi:MAG: hypothetical protein GC165_06275 [Armatimonadetes bacterium]|nr:hypothetical protein [Armatimonadota bacterium]MBS1726097.1 hypothetical protein [Armatimonadota bacterium]
MAEFSNTYMAVTPKGNKADTMLVTVMLARRAARYFSWEESLNEGVTNWGFAATEINRGPMK